MNIRILGLPTLVWVLAGCSSLSTIDELDRSQKLTAQTLQQQSLRMEMQEEYLAQLTESQFELVAAMAKVDRRTKQIKSTLSKQAKNQGQETEQVSQGALQQVTDSEVVALAAVQDKQIVGRNEWIWLELLGRNLKARVDTGALSSSLSAVDLLPFERDGREWIRFRVPDEEHPDGGDMYEAPLIKYVRIRQASADKLERRPVIRLSVRLGGLVDDTEFNLTNREDMLYPALLGRNFLRDVALVDVALKFTQDKVQPPVVDKSASNNGNAKPQ